MLEVGTAIVRTRAEGRQAIPSPSLSRDPVEPVSNTQNKETNTLSLTYDGNPLGVSRTGARQADGSLGWSWGGVRSGPGAARTILLFHIISARPSKQPRMVRTFLKVYMDLGSYFLFLQEI